MKPKGRRRTKVYPSIPKTCVKESEFRSQREMAPFRWPGSIPAQNGVSDIRETEREIVDLYTCNTYRVKYQRNACSATMYSRLK